MRRITLLGALLFLGIFFLCSTIGFAQDQSCGRLKTGDSFNRINEILDCIESKIRTLETKEPQKISPPVKSSGSETGVNDRISNATSMVFGSTIEGKLTKQNRTGWFVFKTPESASDKSVVVFRSIGGETDKRIYLEVYDADEKKLKTIYFDTPNNASIDVPTDKNATYYLRIYSLQVENYVAYELSARKKSTETVR